MIVQTKQVEEFGAIVTLYRAATDDGRKGSLWHSSEEKAVAWFNWHAPLKGWK